MQTRNLEYVTTFDLWKALVVNQNIREKGQPSLNSLAVLRKVTLDVFNAAFENGAEDTAAALRFTDIYVVLSMFADENVPQYLKESAQRMADSYRTSERGTVAVIPDRFHF